MPPSATVNQGSVASETFGFSGGKVTISATLGAPSAGLSGTLALSEDVTVLVADLKAAAEKASAANPTLVAVEEATFDALAVLLSSIK